MSNQMLRLISQEELAKRLSDAAEDHRVTALALRDGLENCMASYVRAADERDALRAEVRRLKDQGRTAVSLFDALKTEQRKHEETRSEVDRLKAALERMTRERDLAIAHDSQPYPTADAYEKACAALHAAKAERDTLRAEGERLKARMPREPFDVRCADALANEVDRLVRRRIIDSRSPAADALVEYRNPPTDPRQPRLETALVECIAALEAACSTCVSCNGRPDWVPDEDCGRCRPMRAALSSARKAVGQYDCAADPETGCVVGAHGANCPQARKADR